MTQNPRNLEDDLNTLARAFAPRRPLAPDILRRLPGQPRRNLPFSPSYSRRWIMRTSLGIAAAAFLTATILLFLTPQQSAFAQVLQKIETTHTLSCDIDGVAEGTFHLAIRGKMMRGERPDGFIAIGDRSTGTWVTLNPKERTAMKYNSRPPFDLYAWFHDFKDGKEERLGDKQLDGKKVSGFRITRSPLATQADGAQVNLSMTIWVDPATNLPVDAEGAEDGRPFHITNFQWDLPLDEKLFAMDIPEGYKIQDAAGISATQLAPPLTTQEAAKLILHPGVGIGDLKFGDDADHVTQFLGKPEKISNNIGWDYPSKGLWLTVHPRQGLIQLMAGSKKTFPSFNVNDFPGKLDNGLAIGSARDDVENAYGKPTRTENAPDNPTIPSLTTVLHYDQLNLRFAIQDGKVTQIFLDLSPAAREAIRARLATQPASQPASKPDTLP
jgi:hypothetical protein